MRSDDWRRRLVVGLWIGAKAYAKGSTASQRALDESRRLRARLLFIEGSAISRWALSVVIFSDDGRHTSNFYSPRPLMRVLHG